MRFFVLQNGLESRATHYFNESLAWREVCAEQGIACRIYANRKAPASITQPLGAVPPALGHYRLELANGGTELIYSYEENTERRGIADLLHDLNAAGIRFKDLHTTQSSLEDIFVDLVGAPR